MIDVVRHEYVTLADKYSIPEYLYGKIDPSAAVDAIDITGAVLASTGWSDTLKSANYRGAEWRILLLKPGSRGFRVRATESTVWCGDERAMEDQLWKNIDRLKIMAEAFGIELVVRFYSRVPISRYMRVGNTFFQSVYPADRTGRYTPIAVLPAASVLAERAKKEFEVLWMESK